MTGLSSLLADVTEQARPTKPPLPERGIERIQAQWEDLTDRPFDFAAIQKLLNVAKSSGGGAQTVAAVFDEVYLTGEVEGDLVAYVETKLRGRLAVVSAPPEGIRRGHTVTYNEPAPEPTDPDEVLFQSFCHMVRFGLSLGVKRTVRIGGMIEVPLSTVWFKDGTMYIGGEDARTFYTKAYAGTSGEGLQDTSTNSASTRGVHADDKQADAAI